MATDEIWRSPERLRLAFKKWRRAAGLSQAEVAERVQLRPQAVGCFERGESDMSRASRQRLAEAMVNEGGEPFLTEQGGSGHVARPNGVQHQPAAQTEVCPYPCPQDGDMIHAQMECMRLGREDLLEEIMHLVEEVAEVRAQAGRLNGRLYRIMAELGMA